MWLSALALIAAAGFVFVSTGLAALAAILGKIGYARFSALTAAAGIATYTVVLSTSGMLSSRDELSVGEEKYICELDCHFAYSVKAGAHTDGSYAITMQMRFDRESISTRRDDSPLMPGPRKIVLIAADGREYQPVRAAGLHTALRPGQSSDVRLEFDLPANATPAYLRFEDADPVKRLLIGSETAPLHKAAWFRLS